MSFRRAGLPILGTALVLTAGWADAQPPYFAIEHARIVPVSGPVIERGTIVLADGLISDVGADAAIPPEAERIDGSGLTVYPGLIDALTTLGLPAERTERSPGGSAPRAQPSARSELSRGPEDRPGSTPWEVAADAVAPDDRRIARWRAGGFTTALVAPQRGILPGQASLVNLAGARARDMVVASPVALPVPMDTLRRAEGFPSSRMGVFAYIHQVFLDARHAALAAARYAEAPRGRKRPEYDRTLDALIAVLADERPLLLPAANRVEILRMLAFADELEVPAILYGAHGAYDAAAETAASGRPLLVSVSWPARDDDEDPEADEPLRLLRFRDRAPGTPAALVDAGVPFAFYSDGLETPREMLQGVRRAIDAGLTPDRAIAALTQHAADILGVGDRLGSLEAGKIANLVVTDGDLFDETSRVRLVFVDGRKYEPAPERTRGRDADPTPARASEGGWR